MRSHPLILILHLVVVYFLNKRDQDNLALFEGQSFAYLLDAVLISLFKREDLVRAFLSVIDLFPRLLLLLLEQSDTIGK